jgi:hypothetical protein
MLAPCSSKYREKLNSVAFSPQVNYTDRAVTDFRLLEGYLVVSRTGPTAVNLDFLDRSSYFLCKQLLSYPHKAVLDPLMLRKSGCAGNQTRDVWIYSLGL